MLQAGHEAIERFCQVHLGRKDFGNAEKDVRVVPFHAFCVELDLP
jgi:hypothetical protein